MIQNSSSQEILDQTKDWFQNIPSYFANPYNIVRNYNRENLQGDLIASLTVAVVLLPQAIAYALIAQLPPQTGLFAAIIAGMILIDDSVHRQDEIEDILDTPIVVSVPNQREYRHVLN